MLTSLTTYSSSAALSTICYTSYLLVLIHMHIMIYYAYIHTIIFHVFACNWTHIYMCNEIIHFTRSNIFHAVKKPCDISDAESLCNFFFLQGYVIYIYSTHQVCVTTFLQLYCNFPHTSLSKGEKCILDIFSPFYISLSFCMLLAFYLQVSPVWPVLLELL